MNISHPKLPATTKTILCMATIFASFLVANSANSEQRPANESYQNKGHERPMQHNKNRGDRKHRNIAILLKHLDLSDVQKSKIDSIIKAADSESKKLQKEIQEKRQALRTEIKNNGFIESNVRAIAKQQADIMANKIVLKAKKMNDIRLELTDEQKTKFDKKISRHRS